MYVRLFNDGLEILDFQQDFFSWIYNHQGTEGT